MPNATLDTDSPSPPNRDLHRKIDSSNPFTGLPIIFVTGASRSGTTMLARIFGGNSEVLALQELHFFGSLCDPSADPKAFPDDELIKLAAILIARHSRGLWSGKPTDAERLEAAKVVARLGGGEKTAVGLFAAAARQLAEDAGKRVACEQTPRNIFYARRLLDRYPQARFVHIVRDPRAVLASQKKRWSMRRHGAPHLPVSEMVRNWVNYHPVTMGKLWLRANDEALRLAEHPRFTIVRFEDLAASAEDETSKLCEFLGLRFQAPMVRDLPQWGSSNADHSSSQRGVSKEAVDRWSSVLSSGETLICEKITEELMHRFGYSPRLLGKSSRLQAVPNWLTYPLHVLGVVALNPKRAWIQLRALRSRLPA